MKIFLYKYRISKHVCSHIYKCDYIRKYINEYNKHIYKCYIKIERKHLSKISF